MKTLEVVYNDVIQVRRGSSSTYPRGSIVVLLGANGVGKTTLLRALTGLLDVHDGRVTLEYACAGASQARQTFVHEPISAKETDDSVVG